MSENEVIKEEIIETEISSEDTETTESTKSKLPGPIMKLYRIACKCRFLLLIMAIILFISAAYMIFRAKQAEMPLDHVYVCDNPSYLSDFDNWIKEDLQVTWVPSYIVIKDGYVIGAFDGDICERDFSDLLGTYLSMDLPLTEVTNLEIENLEGERKPANEIFGTKGTYILEVVWIDCHDCQHQDENYTDDIYYEYSTKNIYRYYLRSEKEKVLEKYQ